MNPLRHRSVFLVLLILFSNLLDSNISIGQSCSSNNIGFNNNTATNALSICLGTSGTTLDGGNPFSGETYLWQVSTTLSTGPFSTVSPNPGDAEDWTISSVYYNTAGTYYFRRVVSGSLTCNGNSDIVTLTVNALPGSVSVSGGGTICGASTTLTASNGGSGTIYFQGTISGGTSTATPAASQLITSPGTYYFRARSTSGCWGTQGSATVIITAPPPITTGVEICQGSSGSLTSSTTCIGYINSGSTISGTWNAVTDPLANRLSSGITNSATCSFESPAVIRNYSAQNLQVSVTGNYTFTMTRNGNYNGMGYLVSGAFVPGNCAGGGTFIKGDDNSGPGNETLLTAALTAGVTYTLISTTRTSNSGTYSGSFIWTVTPPTGGQVMLPASGTIQWFTTTSGGSAIGSGTPFNPVGKAGSGLANTNTPGTTVYYAACSTNPGCRTATNFVINPNATINLVPGAGINIQSVCRNSAISSIKYSIGGGGTGAIVTGLPTGVGGTYNAGVFTISGIPTTAGVYNYTVTTTGTCTQATMTGTITAGTPPTATFTKTMASACHVGNDGSISVKASGGALPYTYSWTGPNDYTANTAVITGLETGDYTVIVRDAFSCPVTIPDITIWKAFATVVTNNGNGSASCASTGAIILYGSGGVPPYTYSINGSNYFSTNTFINLAAGTYTGYVKDLAGCVSIKPGIVVSAAQPMVVTANSRPANSCSSNGTIELYRTGGVPPYTYSLNDVSYQSGNTFSNLAGGTTYTGWVKDSKGCKASLAGIVVAKAAAITVTSTKTNTNSCSNTGSIELRAGGGVPGYTYSLNNVTYQSSNAFSGLAAGTYNGWVKDSKGCKNVQFGITVGTAPASVMNITAYTRSASSCANDGSIELYRTGGTGPYTYSLNNITYQSSNIFPGLAAGIYTGWVKDSKGCKNSLAGITVTKPSAVTVTEHHTKTSTCINDGTIQLYAAGGTASHTYSLDGITYQTGNSFSGLAAGNYTCWVKDTRGCKASVNITISLNPINVTAYSTGAESCTAGYGSIQLFRTGGAGPYTYSLDSSTYQASTMFTGLFPGLYTGYVKDSKACVGTLSNINIGPDCPTGTLRSVARQIQEQVNESNVFSVAVYPNPTSSEFVLSMTGDSKQKIMITVMDILGRTVYQSASSGTKQVRFGSNLKPGIYVVQVVQGDKKQVIKLIKE